MRSMTARTGAAACAALLVLAGCSSDTEPESLEGTTIVYAVQAFSHEAIQPVVDEFTAATGIEVVLEGGPSSGQDLLTQLVPAFNAGTTPYDVVDVDDPAGAALVAGGWLEPLAADAVEPYLADLSEGMALGHEQWNVRDGDTYRLYHSWELGYSWANQTLLDEYGLDVPATWDDIRAAGEVLRPDGIYAFGDAASMPGLTFVYLAHLVAQAGGDLYSADSATREAFEFAKELIDDGHFPVDALTWTYDQSNATYMADELATMRQWPFFYDVARGNTEWFEPEKATIVDPPAGPAGPRTWAGGWGMAVPQASDNKEAAMQFVAYMNSPEVAVRLAEASSFFVNARDSVLGALSDDDLVAALKHYSDSGFVVPRPYHPQAAQAETLVDDIGQSYLTGQISIDQAMDRLQTEIAALG